MKRGATDQYKIQYQTNKNRVYGDQFSEHNLWCLDPKIYRCDQKFADYDLQENRRLSQRLIETMQPTRVGSERKNTIMSALCGEVGALLIPIPERAGQVKLFVPKCGYSNVSARQPAVVHIISGGITGFPHRTGAIL